MGLRGQRVAQLLGHAGLGVPRSDDLGDPGAPGLDQLVQQPLQQPGHAATLTARGAVSNRALRRRPGEIVRSCAQSAETRAATDASGTTFRAVADSLASMVTSASAWSLV